MQEVAEDLHHQNLAGRPGASATSPTARASRGAAAVGWQVNLAVSSSVERGEPALRGHQSRSPRKADAGRLYEKLYCARGEMENRIKEQQLDLFADRTGASHELAFAVTSYRFYFSSFAYVLMHALRRLVRRTRRT